MNSLYVVEIKGKKKITLDGENLQTPIAQITRRPTRINIRANEFLHGDLRFPFRADSSYAASLLVNRSIAKVRSDSLADALLEGP